MSIPTLPTPVWELIKDLDPIGEGENQGYWIIDDEILVLFNASGTWELVLKDEDPQPPPQDQGRLMENWDTVKGGTLNEANNFITQDNAEWQIHHEEGSETSAGFAVPLQVP